MSMASLSMTTSRPLTDSDSCLLLSFVPCWTPRAIPPSCMARRSSGNVRRPGNQRGKGNRVRFAPRLDPILDDNDIDTTDITTYVSCPTCFNSLMIRPQQLARGPIVVTCNCCGRKVTATSEMLENMDGSPFDQQAWHTAEDKDSELDALHEFLEGER